jgi:hypothetical protein
VVVFDGQSLNNASSGGATSPNTFPYQTMAGLSKDLPWHNVGVNGTSWTVLQSSAARRSYALAEPYSKAVLVLTGGASDIANAQENNTAAEALADMEAYADAARAAGFDYIIASTVTPSAYFDAGDEAELLALNEGIRNSDHWEDVADMAAVPELQDNTNLIYFWGDQTHFTDVGAAAAAVPVIEALEAFLAS